MAFTLPKLPYAENALEPYISARTMGLHHGTHHQAYVTNLNKLIDGTDLAGRSLDEIVLAAAGDASKQGIFNNAGQHWNHALFWEAMRPNGGGRPSGRISGMIDSSFGSFDKFAEAFKQAALTRFGSGWAWLVQEGDTLKCTNTLNGDNPLAHGQNALLGIDVWEHAYYLDYQSKRGDYVDAFIGHLVNWDFVASRLK
jgi:Fe-Mn family superoxide dismutase